MSEPSFHEAGGVLAAPPPPTRRLGLAAAAATLAILLAAAGIVIAIWPTVPSRGLLATLSGPRGQEYSAAFSPDGKTLAVVNDDGISLWNVATRRWTATLTGRGCQDSAPGEGVTVVYSPDGKTLAEFTEASTVCLWNLATGQETTLTDPCPVTSSYSPEGVFSPDGTTLAVADCSSAGVIYLWDLATRHLTSTLTYPSQDGLASLAFGPDGMLAADSLQSTFHIYLWNLATRHLTATLTSPGQDDSSLAFGPDGMLAIGDAIGPSVYLLNVTARKLTATIHLPFSQAQFRAFNAQLDGGGAALYASAVFSPDGKMLAANAVFGYGTYMYDVATGKLLATLTDPGTRNSNSDTPQAIVFSPHGSMLAVVDNNGRTYLWQTG